MSFFITGCLLVYCLISTYTDIKTRRIYNVLTYPFFFLMLIIRIQDPKYYLGLIPAFIFFLLFVMKPQAIGAGDIKMLALIGLCLGDDIIVAVFWMCFTSIIYWGYAKVKRQGQKSIPLAPFTTFGVLVSIFIPILS